MPAPLNAPQIFLVFVKWTQSPQKTEWHDKQELIRLNTMHLTAALHKKLFMCDLLPQIACDR